jgi:hypothetical protein
MNINNDIIKELNELGGTLPDSRLATFIVPDHYFDDFPNQVLQEIKIEESLSSLPPSLSYSVSADYFNTILPSVLDQIKEEEFLHSIPQKMPYHIPVGYFAQSAKEILQTANMEKPLKSGVTLYRTRMASFSIAASLVLFLSIGFKLLNAPTIPSFEKELSGISDNEIISYINLHQTEFENDLTSSDPIDESKLDMRALETEIYDTELNKITDEEISTYIL